MKNKIRIRLKAYDHKLLDKSVGEIVDSVKSTGVRIAGPIPLPTDRTLYTVLRSPNVDKKAQEQFEMIVYKRIIDIIEPTNETTDVLKKVSLPAGVHVEVKL